MSNSMLGWIAGGIAAVLLIVWLAGGFSSKKKTAEVPAQAPIVLIG